MIELLNTDCMEYMATCEDKKFGLAIVDPPYGININMNMGRKKGEPRKHTDKKWDSNIPDIQYFEELFRVSKNQIIWGGNYFRLPPTKHFIFWDKKIPKGMSFSDGEYAWTSFNRAIKKYTLINQTGDKIHPTQKPVALYRWLLENYAKEGDLILDTHAGSFSSAVACKEKGFDGVFCELDSDYFDAGKARVDKASRQYELIKPEKQEAEQQDLL